MLSLDECHKLARKEYRRYDPYFCFLYGHYCYVRLKPKRGRQEAMPDGFLRIDRYIGQVSGYVSVEEVMADPVLRSCFCWGALFPEVLRDYPERYCSKGVLEALKNGIARLRSRLPGGQLVQAEENRMKINMRREME